MILRRTAALWCDPVRVVETGQSLTIRTVQRQRIVEAVRLFPASSRRVSRRTEPNGRLPDQRRAPARRGRGVHRASGRETAAHQGGYHTEIIKGRGRGA